jgi:hypothetical protein
MEIDFEKFRSDGGSSRQKIRTYTSMLRPRLIELWIAASIAIFFLLRVLGSQYGQRIIGLFRNHLQQ